MAQLQKQKKKANKKPAGPDASKDSATPAEGTPAPKEKQDEAAVTSEPAEKKPEDGGEEKKGEEKTTEPEQPVKHEESPTEPMPEVPTALPSEVDSSRLDAPRAHGRQPSLSIQSKMRSSSFRKTSVSQGSVSPSPSTIRSPSLPPLSADGDSVQEVYRKQSTQIGELEKDKKRLEKELEETTGRWRKTEEQLEDLQETTADMAELKDKLVKAEQKVAEIDALVSSCPPLFSQTGILTCAQKEEIASLQRQNSHLQSKSHRNNAPESPPSDLVQQLESKSATIEAMELEISNLRAHETQVKALQQKVTTSESALEDAQRELADTKQALTRASEKAVKEGVEKTSTETLIKNLEREIGQLKREKAEADKKNETLEKKLEALGNLHRESESRHQARLQEGEKTEKETAVLKKKLASVENENLRLKEEQESLNLRLKEQQESSTKRDSSGGTDDEAIDELENEGRAHLERRIRELEGENFDLRRGVWKERRQELEAEQYGLTPPNESDANAFDDVDLVGGAPEHARRRSIAQQQQQRHSSFSTVLSSGLAAFTGGGNNRGRASSSTSNQNQGYPPATRGSLELLSEENIDDFDEDAFARAQAEEEGKKRVEWAREIKSKLNDWKGWRLDWVVCRAGAYGAGVGMGEIFVI